MTTEHYAASEEKRSGKLRHVLRLLAVAAFAGVALGGVTGYGIGTGVEAVVERLDPAPEQPNVHP
jgi:membrane protein YqaA with SNARE-associated domain